MGFRGQIAEIPIGVDGMIGSPAHPLVSPSRLIDCDNIEYGTGVLRKEGGAEKYNDVAITGGPDVIGGHDWWPTSATQRMVVMTSTGDLLKDSGAGTFPVTLASGLTVPDDIPIFVDGGKEAAAGNRKLFIFTGKNAVQVLSADGATAAAITSPPADWAGTNQPKTGCIHVGRLWGAGNLNDPHRVYASLTTDHEDFTGTPLSVSVFPGEGEGIAAIFSFKGLLVVFKNPAGVYVVDTQDPNTANWVTSRISKEIGIAGPGGGCIIDDDILFLEHGGEFNLISAVQEFGNLGTKSLSDVLEMTDFIHENFNKEQLHKTASVFYADNREAHFYLPGSGSTHLNIRVVFDWKREIPRFRISRRDDEGHYIFLRKKENVRKPYIGYHDGFVYELDTEARAVEGVGYEGMFQTPHLDFSHLDPKLATKRKSGMFLELLTIPEGNWDLAVEVYWDGEYTQTINFNMGSSGVALGTFEIGVDRLAQDQLLNRKKRLMGSGRRLSLKGKNSGVSQDFSASKFFVHFKVNDERE
jgi:hypothetical protein